VRTLLPRLDSISQPLKRLASRSKALIRLASIILRLCGDGTGTGWVIDQKLMQNMEAAGLGYAEMEEVTGLRGE
jgi:hypothetical protein